MTQDLPRTPPADVRRVLRQEVRFGCPVAECRLPFLEYHHFDPEWHVEHHHRPEGMIPLCPTHHAQADAWNATQLRAMKEAAAGAALPTGRFPWLREQLLGIAGCLMHHTDVMVMFRDEPMIWFERDEHGTAQLNLRMLSLADPMERTRVANNDFLLRGTPTDIECPPSGTKLWVRYEGGDEIVIRFREFLDPEAARTAHPVFNSAWDELTIAWPATAVEITMKVGGTNILIKPGRAHFGAADIRGGVVSGCGAGIVLD